MFYYIEGKAALVEQGLCVVDCAGVGYACAIPHSIRFLMSSKGKALGFILIYMFEKIFLICMDL